MARDTLILSADTSGAKFSVALLRGDSIIAQYQSKDTNMASMDMLPAIDRILSESSYRIEDVGLFCIGTGPGSFTGLRVGVTTMRAMALSLNKPIIGIPSIDAIAQKLLRHKGKLCVIIDARQNKLYARIYESNGKFIKPKSRFLLIEIDKLLKKLKGSIVFAGDGINLYKDSIKKASHIKSEFLPAKDWYAKAATLGRIACASRKRPKKAEVFTLSPLYIYPKECQVRR